VKPAKWEKNPTIGALWEKREPVERVTKTLPSEETRMKAEGGCYTSTEPRKGKRRKKKRKTPPCRRALEREEKNAKAQGRFLGVCFERQKRTKIAGAVLHNA